MSVEVTAGVWKYGDGLTRPILRVFRRESSSKREFVGVIEYQDARAFADAIHDACDAYETEARQ